MKITDMSESEQAQLHAVLEATKAIDGISPNLEILEQNDNPLEIVRYAYLRTCRIYDVTPRTELLGQELAAKEKADNDLFTHLKDEFDEEFSPENMK